MAYSLKHGHVLTQFGNIPMNEPVVILRAQDSLAEGAISYWCQAAKAAGVKQEVIDRMFEANRAMADWKKKKLPD